MNKFVGLVFSFVLMVGSAVVASAQDQPPPPPPGFGGGGQRMMQFQMPTFAELDKNKDKKLTKDEVPAQFPPQMFDRIDANHDGSIDEEEWKALTSQFSAGRGAGGERMMVAGPRTGEMLSKLLDGNTDSKVSREEFAKIVSLFDALDKDHNGDLSTEELNGFFRAVNEVQNEATGGVEVNNLFEKYDKNKDGKITAEEFGNERLFKSMDLNKDGEVNRAEADTALKQIKKASDAKKTAQPNN